MQTKGRIFDDLARVANGAAGTLSGVRHEIEGVVKQRLERVLADMDLVGRDEFEAVKEVAAKARLEQEALEARVGELEAEVARLAASGGPSKGGRAQKGRAKKAQPKKAAAKKAAAKTAAAKKA
ncbi:MAG: accessory factor UbiK family protein [Marivibrio sp.]|uniref:accessory factor UbiK family protein n=1 Tax=Marivibrio sp. TaxID=2039719 RepID=UPI0032EC73D5